MPDAATMPPPNSFVDHQGNPLTAADPPPVAPPPAAIGRVVSVDPTHRRSQWAWITVLLAGVFGLPALVLIPSLLTEQGAGIPPAVVWAAEAVVVALAAWGIARLFRRVPTTTYVGTEGLAEFTGRRGGGGGEVRGQRVLRFADATELMTGSVRRFVNGVYAGTSYSYRWVDADGKPVLKLTGKFSSQAGTPKAHDRYYFGRTAERVWTDHFMERSQEQLDRDHYMHFRVRKADYVRVGLGVMELHFGSRTERLERDQIAKANLTGGFFHIATHDATRFGRAGKFSFNYASMANARAFLVAVDQLMGLRFN